MILETDRLIVREFQEDDINLMMEYSQESGKRSELPDEVFETVAEAESYLRMRRKNYAAGEYPLVYAIVLKELNHLIGDIQLCPFQIGTEISYSVAEQFQGNGYAAEAIGPFVRWAKENLQLSVIYGFVKKAILPLGDRLKNPSLCCPTKRRSHITAKSLCLECIRFHLSPDAGK